MTTWSAWDSVTFMVLIAAALTYAAGSRRMHAGGGRLRAAERASFWIGWATLIAAITPWMDRAVTQSFSAHMAQHEMLMVIGAPLIVVGRPIVPWLWALPAAMRLRTGGFVAQVPRSMWRWLTTPLVAWGLHGVAIWLWHAPVLYEAAVDHEALHALQHATFVGTSVLFWWGLVYGRYGRAAYGASALYVFTTMMHTGLLGAMFALSTSPFYPLYRDRAHDAGIDAAYDQQLAGLYMWIPAGVVLTIFGLALVLAWLAESDRRGGIRLTSRELHPHQTDR
jgi:putative membrane protein